MSLRLICGRSGTGKSEIVLNETIEKLNNNIKNKIYIITPEQFSYSMEKKLLEKQKSGAIIGAEVLTFKRMAYRVENEVGKAINTNLSKCGKNMLLYSILMNSKSNLKFLGKNEQNVELIDTALTEFKKHSVTVDNLKNAIDNEEDRYLKEKLKDITYIYEKYEEKIKDKYIDENDVLTILANNIELTDMFKDTIIYIDEFTGYTKQEYNIIEKLLKCAKSISVTVTTDDLDMGTTPDTDVFYSNKQTADKLLFLARNNNIECEKTVFLNENKRFNTEELQFLEQNLYKVPYNKYEKDVNNLSLFLANNAYSEIEYVAKEIITLVKKENYRYRDIGIITKNLESYSSLAKAIFQSYDIPVFIDEKGKLSQNIFIKYIVSFLDVLAKSFSYDSVINYIKSGFLNLDDDDIYLFEEYTRRWGIKGSKWYNGEWNFEEITDKNKEKIEKIQQIREDVIKPIIAFKNGINNKTVEEITKLLYAFLMENKINEKLIYKKEEQEKEGYVELSNEQKIAWEIVIQIFDELISIFGDEKITFDKYMSLLKVGLNASGLGKIPQTQDQVIMGDIERSRTHKAKAIFILGINDGVFPSIHKDEGFLGDEDRNKLKTEGIELAKGTLEMLYEENFSIYKALTAPEERLFLSYVSTGTDGGSLRPSILINKVKKIFPKIIEKSDMIENNEIELISENDIFDKLIENLGKFRDGEKINKDWFEIYNIYSKNDKWKEKLESAIKALSYTNIPENITKENVEGLYVKTLNTTVSILEKYKACAFSYYLQYGLKIQEKNEFKMGAIDTGNFMHDTIDSFFTTVREEGLNIKELNEDEIYKIIEKIIEEKLLQIRNYIFTSSEKYKVLTTRLKRVITRSMKYIIESLKDSDFEVFGNELEFKKGKTYEPIKITLEDGKKVEITGKIDRVDIAKNTDGKYIRIIDYKSSVKNIDLNEVQAGLQLQLLTYLDATCKIEEMMPAGVLYFSLIDPMIKANKMMTNEEIEAELKKQFKMNGIILADVNVVKMMDKKLESGQSNMIPAYIDKSGNLSKRSNAVTKEQFEDLQKYTVKIIKDISKEILDGNISMEPYYNIKNKKTPCEYCEYKPICQFKAGTNGNHYNYIGKKEKQEILEEMRNS